MRGVDRGLFPYVHGHIGADGLEDGAIEYPVLTGLFMWATGLGADSVNSYLVVSAIALAPAALLTAYLLARLHRLRALLWAAAPAVVLYAFHNWDLLVIAATTTGFYLWARGRGLGAAVAFGVGGAFKLYPLLFLAPLVLEALWERDRRRALMAAVAGLGTFAAVNLPFAIINFKGWWATYAFHRARGPNFDNIWAIRDFGPVHLPLLEPSALNVVSGGLTLIFFAAVLIAGAIRSRRGGRFPFVQTSAALLAVFLLWGKVHSPQYTLWILPFFVLLDVRIWWWVAYSIVDLVTYLGVFRLFYAFGSGTDPGFYELTMKWGVGLRAVLLSVLTVVFLRSSRAGGRPARVASHPVSRVGRVGDLGERPV